MSMKPGIKTQVKTCVRGLKQTLQTVDLCPDLSCFQSQCVTQSLCDSDVFGQRYAPMCGQQGHSLLDSSLSNLMMCIFVKALSFELMF